VPDSTGDQTAPFTLEHTGGFAAQGVLDGRPYSADRLHPDEWPEPEPVVPHPAPVVIPGVPQFVGRGRFLLVLVGTWLLAGAAGAGLYWWWFHSADKAMPVFAVLVVTVGCVVGSLLTSLVQNKPSVSALALAMMSAPLACAAGAALLYGGYVFGWVSP
jgi:hypothetical protein